MGYILRWVVAFLLLALTFNPTQYNFIHWALSENAQLSFVVLAGLILVVGYIIFLRATLRSIGGFGMALVLALVAALLWVFYDLGWLDLDNSALNIWLGIFALSVVLGVGLSWSHVRRALSGQADIDDVDQ